MAGTRGKEGKNEKKKYALRYVTFILILPMKSTNLSGKRIVNILTLLSYQQFAEAAMTRKASDIKASS